MKQSDMIEHVAGMQSATRHAPEIRQRAQQSGAIDTNHTLQRGLTPMSFVESMVHNATRAHHENAHIIEASRFPLTSARLIELTIEEVIRSSNATMRNSTRYDASMLSAEAALEAELRMAEWESSEPTDQNREE